MEAFELTEEAKSDGFSGGTVKTGPLGHAFDVHAALENGDGVIVTDDPGLVEILRSYPVLQGCDVPEGAKPVEVPGEAEQTKGPEVPWTPQQPLDVGVGSVGEVNAVHGEEDVPAEVTTGGQSPATSSPVRQPVGAGSVSSAKGSTPDQPSGDSSDN